MVSPEGKSIIDRAKRLYADRLQSELERDHFNRFVSIEPESGEFFLGNTLDELKKRRAEARQAGSDFHIAELSVEVGDIAAPLVNERTIKDLKFVNVKRMTASLQSIILSEFSKYASQRGETEDLAKIQQIARRPDLFEPLLDESPLFKHLDLIIIPVADDPRRPSFIRQVGYIRNSAKITHIEQNTERNEFVLPDGMTLSD